jgi:hypothetical protein
MPALEEGRIGTEAKRVAAVSDCLPPARFVPERDYVSERAPPSRTGSDLRLLVAGRGPRSGTLFQQSAPAENEPYFAWWV